MSSGQSLRNGNSVEPGLPNTLRMPNARNRLRVASLTVTEVAEVLAGLRDNALLRHSGMVRRTRPGISRFSDVQLHIVARCFASPRNDGLLVTTTQSPSSSDTLLN